MAAKGAWGGTGSRGGIHKRRHLPLPTAAQKPCGQCGERHPGLVHQGRWLVKAAVPQPDEVE